MKVSELKKYVKEQIIQTLEEVSKEDIANQKQYNDELAKTAELADKIGMKLENKKKD